jgi:hypothetical protein
MINCVIPEIIPDAQGVATVGTQFSKKCCKIILISILLT